MTNCPNCGKPVEYLMDHLMSQFSHQPMLYFCSPKAERSEAPQGCPPSATGSADARAADEAGADSAGRSADKAVRRRAAAPDAEIASHINVMMDELKWFYEHGVTLNISPSEKGWSIKFTVPDEGGDAHSAA